MKPSSGSSCNVADVSGPDRQTVWDPAQYARFSDHRLRPALELLDRVPLTGPERVVDLGCGSGEVTRRIAERWPGAEVLGVDHSREMIEKAAATPGRVRWETADIRTWSPGAPVDLLYSNAALHWLEDHDTLFPRLIGFLRPEGVLAVQMPLSWSAPSHRLMREVLTEGPYGSEALRRRVGRNWVAEPAVYYDLLRDGATGLDIWETEYLQILDGEDPVLEWVKGTGLRPILNELEGAERAAFLETYRRRLREVYPRRADGCTLYPFRRLFLVARR